MSLQEVSGEDTGMNRTTMRIYADLVSGAADAISGLINGVSDPQAMRDYRALAIALREQLSRSREAIEDERVEFEKEALNQGKPDLERRADGDYRNFYLQCAWLGWQQKAQTIEAE